MEKRISKDEMDALLGDATNGGPSAAGSAAANGVMIYDFRRPDRVSKAMFGSLRLLHEKFCSSVESALSTYLRTATEVSVQSLDQLSYGEFVSSLSEPACFNALNMSPLTTAALQLDLELVFPMIDRLTGGSGAGESTPVTGRKITDIEQTIIAEIIGIVTKRLTDSWRTLDVVFAMKASETSPQLLHIAAVNEPMVLIVFEIKFGSLSSHMRLCIPYAALERIRQKFEQDSAPPTISGSPDDLKNLFANVLKAPLEITADLPPTMITIRDLLELCANDIVTLDTKVTDCIRICIARMPSYEGRLVRVNRRKTAKVTGAISDRRRYAR